MPERWQDELAKVDRISPDPERLRARTQTPSTFPGRLPSRRSRLTAAAIAILVFALAISVFVIPTLVSPGPTPAPTSPSPSPSFVPGAPKADALAEAHRLVGLTQVPPGSQPISESPVRALSFANGVLSCATEPCHTALDVSAFWLVPLPVDGAVSWLDSHPPAGLFSNGDHGSSATASGRVTSVSWNYQDGPGPAYTIAELMYTVAPVGAHRSVLRVDGQVMWVPPRTDAEHVPDDVDVVRVEKYVGRHVVAQGVLTGSEAGTLARLLNDLGRINMGPPRCPFTSEKTSHYTMVFPRPAGSMRFTDWPECSSGPVVFVTADGQSQPALSGDHKSPMPSGLLIDVATFLDCQLGTGDARGCSLLLRNSGPSPTPAADPIAVFCGNLRQLSDWFAKDVAEANGDETALARSVTGQLGGVMMWFHPAEQAISDPEARAEGDAIIADALALQNWPSSGAAPFQQVLDTFSRDSASFSGRYCS